MTKIKWIAVLAVILFLVSVFFIWDSKEVLNGQWQKEENLYAISFTQMNAADSHTLNLAAGDELAVSYAIRSGRVDLSVVDEDGTVLYRGTRLGDGAFGLPVEKDGIYTVTVTARHAAGTVRVVCNGTVVPKG